MLVGGKTILDNVDESISYIVHGSLELHSMTKQGIPEKSMVDYLKKKHW